MKNYRMSSVTSIVLKLKVDERIDGDDLWSCLSFIIVIEVDRQVGSYKEGNGSVWGAME